MNNPGKQRLITTERLHLRLLDPESYAALMNTAGDDELRAFFGFVSDQDVLKERERFRQGMTMAGRSFRYFHLIGRTNGVVMGWCGYHTWFTQHRRAELGYVLNEESFRNKGLMKEALPHVIRYGFKEMQLFRIEALVSPGNIPSVKLLEGGGFQKEGHLRKHYMKNDVLEDSIIYSLLRDEYPD